MSLDASIAGVYGSNHITISLWPLGHVIHSSEASGLSPFVCIQGIMLVPTC